MAKVRECLSEETIDMWKISKKKNLSSLWLCTITTLEVEHLAPPLPVHHVGHSHREHIFVLYSYIKNNEFLSESEWLSIVIIFCLNIFIWNKKNGVWKPFLYQFTSCSCMSVAIITTCKCLGCEALITVKLSCMLFNWVWPFS